MRNPGFVLVSAASHKIEQLELIAVRQPQAHAEMIVAVVVCNYEVGRYGASQVPIVLRDGQHFVEANVPAGSVDPADLTLHFDRPRRSIDDHAMQICAE